MNLRLAAVAYCFFSVAYTAFLHPHPSLLTALLKPLPILFLALITARSVAPGWRGLVSAGLVFSAAGDLLLALDDLHGDLFIAGLASFFMAQGAYAVAFWSRRHADPVRRWLAIAYVPAGVLLAGWMLPAAGTLAVPVGIYLLGISAMVTGAALTNRSLLVFAGALCFAVSDTLIGVNKFLAPVPAAGTLIMASYYLAQGLICAGVVRTPAKAAA